MPWETERHCYALNSEWGVWDYSDKLLGGFVHNNILLYPLEFAEGYYGDNRTDRIVDFLKSNHQNKVVLYNFIDACGSPNFPEYDQYKDRIHILPKSIVCFWEYFLSNKIRDHGVTEPNFVNDFLCYQRKPNHHRPQVYDALKDLNGVVTLGTLDFDINENITCSSEMSDIDYENGNPGAPLVGTDIDTLGAIDVWNDSFLIIVSETFSNPTGDFVSEKTFKPMMGKRPFITLGAWDSYYQGLRDRGYHTFENDFPKFEQGVHDVSEYVIELAEFLSTMDQRSYYMDNKQKFDDNYENLSNAIDRNLSDMRNYILQLTA